MWELGTFTNYGSSDEMTVQLWSQGFLQEKETGESESGEGT